MATLVKDFSILKSELIPENETAKNISIGVASATFVVEMILRYGQRISTMTTSSRVAAAHKIRH